jgi:rod shape-determining protein MreD
MSFRKILVIGFICAICFIIEALLGGILGRWFKPNLLLIIVVFFNLSWGTRYCLAAAIIGGLIKDSFSPNFFGMNIFSFIACGYLVTFIKMYVYHVGSKADRVLMVFLIVILNVIIQYLVKVVLSYVNLGQAIHYVFLPEVLTTTIAAGYTFDRLKQCVSNLFV